MAAAVLGGATTPQAIRRDEPNTYHQYGRTIDKLHDDAQRARSRAAPTRGYWLWGRTGTGKSTGAGLLAEVLYPGCEPYWHPDDRGWWDGYEQQEVVIIDDFRPEAISTRWLLRLADAHPLRVPRRGREPAPFDSRAVIVTAPHPYTHYADGEDWNQLARRYQLVCMDD